MALVKTEFEKVMVAKNWNAQTAARELGVSRASFYKYLAKDDVPSLAVLRRAVKNWGVKLKYADYALDDEFFENSVRERGPVKEKQIPLPFIEGLRNEDIEVLAVIPRKPNAVELKLRIKFAAQSIG
jgi:transcriptional regulator with XRE-family HTH domain